MTWLLALAVIATACSCPRRDAPVARRFQFPRDSVAFTNEVHWIYSTDAATGKTTHRKREPEPEYSFHCFAVSRLNRQFFDHAAFDPTQPRSSDQALREAVREVVGRSTRCPSLPADRVGIPGYSGLRELSVAEPALLKELGGSAASSFLQRGHWRMILPFSRRHQARTAEALLEGLASGRPRVLHLVRFPQLTINHAVLAIDARRTATGVEIDVVDPNDSSRFLQLRFDAEQGRFAWPATLYFGGGTVNVYEIYRNAWY